LFELQKKTAGFFKIRNIFLKIRKNKILASGETVTKRNRSEARWNGVAIFLVDMGGILKKSRGKSSQIKHERVMCGSTKLMRQIKKNS